MSDTPETDKAGKFWPCEQLELVDSDFARRLERERDEAIKKIWRLEKQIEGSNNFANERFEEIQRVRRERDEAIEKLNQEMKWHHRTHKELVEAQCKLLDIEYDKLPTKR
jgi:uncharacterized coiled-coil DUF342 family protein